MKRTMQKPRKRINKPKECYFCKNKSEANYKELKDLERFISERGKIMGKMYTGLCQKHQKQLTTGIKRARYLALLPFIVRPS